MAVVAQFSGTPLVGTPTSFQVQFTDLSTGSPNAWLWDFGDGNHSEDQHPLHTYTGTYGDAFTVKLIAIKASASEISHGTINQYKHKQKIAATFGTVAEVLADIQGKSWTDIVSAAVLKSYWFYDGTGIDEESPTYNGAAVWPTANLVLPADSGTGPSTFRLKFNITEVDADKEEGTIIASPGGTIVTPVTGNWIDVTGHSGDIDFEPIITHISITPPQAPFARSGVGLSAALFELPTDAEDDTDSETKVDYVLFGVPPVAEFSASPVAGKSPLSVQFTNLSTPAIGLPTTYSWKKRLSGTADPFVEFSTEENPTEDFTKS
jgi:PKD repeat protein